MSSLHLQVNLVHASRLLCPSHKSFDSSARCVEETLQKLLENLLVLQVQLIPSVILLTVSAFVAVESLQAWPIDKDTRMCQGACPTCCDVRVAFQFAPA